jgi:malonyl-CoA O-methyltransferase
MSTGAEAFQIDRTALRDAFDRASARYDAAAVLQTRVRAELLARLALVKLTPRVILDLGCGTGHAAHELKHRFRRATVAALDLAPGMLREAGRHNRMFRRVQRVCGDACRLPLRAASVDLIFSSLMLQWCDPLDQALGEIARVLKPGGFLSFSTLGPDTLRELRTAWAAADAGIHVNGFADMHDVGDALTRAGLSEPVLDVERITLTYPDVVALMRDLKAIGAHNVTRARARGLTGRGKWRVMLDAYETFRANGRLPATFEIVYGVAWGAAARPGAGHGEIRIPIGAIGRRDVGA